MALVHPYIKDAANNTHYFLSLSHAPAGQALRIERIERPGVEGATWRTHQTGVTATRMIGKVDIEDAAGTATFRQTMLNLKGTVVEVRDEAEQVHENVVVEHVQDLGMKRVLASVGGLNPPSAYMMTFAFYLAMSTT